MPFAGHTPFHARWSAHHRPVASGTHTGTCAITRPGSGDGTLVDGVWTPPAATTVYTGPCRVTPLSGNSRYVVAGEQRTILRGYEIAITWDATLIHEGDTCEVLTAQDPRLEGVQLRVLDVRMGSEQWERVLIAEQDLTDLEA